MNFCFWLAIKYLLWYDNVVNWCHSGFRGRLVLAATLVASWISRHAANHIMCGVWNRQCWSNKEIHWKTNQVIWLRHFPSLKWHWNESWRGIFIISTTGILGYLIYPRLYAGLFLKNSFCYDFSTITTRFYLMLLDYLQRIHERGRIGP